MIPVRRERLSELDALTDQLPAAVNAVARKLDRVLRTAVAVDGGLTIDGHSVCAWCLEDAGTHRCGGHVEQAAALVDWDDADEIRSPIRATGGS
jgi:hypothetical protein